MKPHFRHWLHIEHWFALLLLSFFAFSILDKIDKTHAQPRARFGEPLRELILPKDLPFDLGAGTIPDRESFERLSYQGNDVMRDTYLTDLEFVKFVITKFRSKDEAVYFMNTKNHRAHPRFMPMVGIAFRGNRNVVRGAITFLPFLQAPDGTSGLYIVDFQPNDSYRFQDIQSILNSLIKKMPPLFGKVAFHPLQGNLAQYQQEKTKYAQAGIAVHLDSDRYENITYLPLNVAESFGRLRKMGNELRPAPRDIVLCKRLPNEMPRVAGILTSVRQTPLSHVNLRAVQDKVPNAFIRDALDLPEIKMLIDKWVHYKVTPKGYSIREASLAEVEKHFETIRPKMVQMPKRNLDETKILSLSEIRFADSSGFGVKTANLAAMHRFGLPKGTLPDGYGIPFHFYHEFMKHNQLYETIDVMLNHPTLHSDADALRDSLSILRKKIRNAKMPEWMESAFVKLQSRFPKGIALRCRSSTNNEDLPDFSGAGLYSSFTHHPHEGALSKTIRQVFASLWNDRAFEERAFYRIDHKTSAMAVLIHPSYKKELANGVAVSDDILYGTSGNYYLNTQKGDDLVTHSDAQSSPEEILLSWWKQDGHEVVRYCDPTKRRILLDTQHLHSLRNHLAVIHEEFRKLYGFKIDERFAIEIEYKVTNERRLTIKQARPWVF